MARRYDHEDVLRTSTAAGPHPVDGRPEVPRLLADVRTLGGLNFRSTFDPVYPGPSDPCTHRTERALWRSCRTPDGPGTLHLYLEGHRLWARAFGPGGGWLLAQAPRIASLGDHPHTFQPACPRLRRLRPRTFGLRLAQTPTVMDALLPTIVHQRVKTYEARRSWARVVRAISEAAPGPTPRLWLPPTPKRLLRAPGWWFAQHGIEAKRARALLEACRHADRLNAASSTELTRLFALLPGLGPWTLGNVHLKAYGDPDAVIVGDYHIPHSVTHFFTGRARGSDDEMLELLAPFGGHRARVQRWIGLGAGRAPRFAPKQRFRFHL